MMNTIRLLAALVLTAFAVSTRIHAQGIGAVLKDVAETHDNPADKTAEFKLAAGTFVSFQKGGRWGEYKSEKGKIRIIFFENNDEGLEKQTWIDEDKLEFFQFTCIPAKSLLSDRDTCIPVQARGLQHQWILAFKIAARDKCKALGIDPAKEAVLSKPAKNDPKPAKAKQKGIGAK